MKNPIKVIAVVTIVLILIASNSIACPDNPNCSCDQHPGKAAKSCMTDCKNPCLAAKTVSPAADLKPGNVWTTEDGVQRYICPVMKGEGIVDETVSFSEIDGVRYYHCCPACKKPFSADAAKYLEELVLPGNVLSVDSEGLKRFRDPVDKTTGVVEKDTRYVDHHGKRFYFSSKETMSKFSKNPEACLNDKS